MSDHPDDVRALAAERDERRRARDFEAADVLRDRIAELGYRVTDGPDGAVLEAIGAPDPAASAIRAGDVPSVLGEPATVDASLAWVAQGWHEDIARAVDAFRRFAGERSIHLVVADVTGAGASYGEDVEVLRLEVGTGWGAAMNAALRRARGRIVLSLDGSIEPTGDTVTPLASALDDPGVGVTGPFGISTPDLRDFHESGGVGSDRRVDAIEGYCMAFRRALLTEIGSFDERFRWYRTADIEFSFRAKDAGYRCVVVDVPVRRHEHRMWAATPPGERDRLSKRNFYRFLERFRGRTDLLVEPPSTPEP